MATDCNADCSFQFIHKGHKGEKKKLFLNAFQAKYENYGQNLGGLRLNNIVATISVIIFSFPPLSPRFFSFFLSPSSTFLIEGVFESKKLFCKMEFESPKTSDHTSFRSNQPYWGFACGANLLSECSLHGKAVFKFIAVYVLFPHS